MTESSQIILYQTEDGKTRVEVRFEQKKCLAGAALALCCPRTRIRNSIFLDLV